MKRWGLLSIFLMLSAILALLPACDCGGGDDDDNDDHGDDDDDEHGEEGVGELEFPYPIEFGSDGKMYTMIEGKSFLVEFTAWGAHGGGHTGHTEGDPKSSAAHYIQPAGELIEFDSAEIDPDGNHDGVCDDGEICGVTYDTAVKYALWYSARNEGMELMEINFTAKDTGDTYVTGDNGNYILKILFKDVVLVLDHVRILSDDLTAMLAERAGYDVTASPAEVDWDKFSYGEGGLGDEPLALPKDMALGQAQILKYHEGQGAGQTIYFALGQVEWTAYVWADHNDPTYAACQYTMVSAAVRTQLQTALDVNLTDPAPYSRFTSVDTLTDELQLLGAATGLICQTDYFDATNFDQLNSSHGYGWIDNPMDQPQSELLAISEVHKGTAAYNANADRFYSAATEMILRRDSYGNSLPATIEGEERLISGYDAEVLDLTLTGDTAQNDVLTLKVIPGTMGAYHPNEPPDSTSLFQAVRYKLESDRLVVHWGEFFTEQSAVVAPATIPDNAACDGEPYFCYDHTRPGGVL